MGDRVRTRAAPVGSRPVPPPPQTQRGRLTRAALVEAAREVFTREGLSAAKITDITGTAGVAAGSFYNYFRSKEDLFREIATAAIDDLTAAPRRAPDNPEDDPVRDIAHAVREYVEVCLRYGRLTASIQEVSHVDAALGEHRQRRSAEHARRGQLFIERLQADGRADPDVDAARTAAALQTMTVGVVYDNLVLFETGEDIERLIETITGIWARAIGVTPPAPRDQPTA